MNVSDTDDTEFLSTPSARRATAAACRPSSPGISTHFYPRPPRGGRHQRAVEDMRKADFYPRPPRGGRHVDTFVDNLLNCYFYPRPPRGGRQNGFNTTILHNEPFLSTPSARRATLLRAPRSTFAPDFYPRPPRGGRPASVGFAVAVSRFLSTPSARRATGLSLPTLCIRLYFYPRPPRGGRPIRHQRCSPFRFYFYPRPPRGGRLSLKVRAVHLFLFLSTPSARRATRR